MIPKRKSRILLSGLLVSILVVSVVAGGFTTQGIIQQQSPQISSTSSDIGVGETGTIEVTATEFPNGLSGFDFIVRLENPEVATITNASVSDKFGISNVRVSDDGSEVYLKAVDLGKNIENGSTDVTIATLQVKGEQAGQTGVEFADQNIDSEDGSPANLELVGGTITVGDNNDDGTTTTTTTTSPPDNDDGTTTTTTTTSPPDNDDDTTTTTTTTSPPPDNGDDNGTSAPPNDGDDDGDDNGTTAPPGDGDDNGTSAPPNDGDDNSDDDDCDGLSNQEEMDLGTNPDDSDTDGDGLTDGEEVDQYETNPKKTDSDSDGTPDDEEVADS